MAIIKFRGEHFFLSNMCLLRNGIPTPDGNIVGTTEQAYMAARMGQWASRLILEMAPDGKCAKEQYRILRSAGAPTIEDWGTKVAIMRDVVTLKCELNPEIVELLLATGDEDIIEGNDWRDRDWGMYPVPEPGVKSHGRNQLGIIWMEERTRRRDPNYSVGVDQLVQRIFAPALRLQQESEIIY